MGVLHLGIKICNIFKVLQRFSEDIQAGLFT